MPGVLHVVVRRGRGAVAQRDKIPVFVVSIVTTPQVMSEPGRDTTQIRTHISTLTEISSATTALPTFRALRGVGPVNKPK